MDAPRIRSGLAPFDIGTVQVKQVQRVFCKMFAEATLGWTPFGFRDWDLLVGAVLFAHTDSRNGLSRSLKGGWHKREADRIWREIAAGAFVVELDEQPFLCQFKSHLRKWGEDAGKWLNQEEPETQRRKLQVAILGLRVYVQICVRSLQIAKDIGSKVACTTGGVPPYRRPRTDSLVEVIARQRGESVTVHRLSEGITWILQRQGIARHLTVTVEQLCRQMSPGLVQASPYKLRSSQATELDQSCDTSDKLSSLANSADTQPLQNIGKEFVQRLGCWALMIEPVDRDVYQLALAFCKRLSCLCDPSDEEIDWQAHAQLIRAGNLLLSAFKDGEALGPQFAGEWKRLASRIRGHGSRARLLDLTMFSYEAAQGLNDRIIAKLFVWLGKHFSGVQELRLPHGLDIEGVCFRELGCLPQLRHLSLGVGRRYSSVWNRSAEVRGIQLSVMVPKKDSVNASPD